MVLRLTTRDLEGPDRLILNSPAANTRCRVSSSSRFSLALLPLATGFTAVARPPSSADGYFARRDAAVCCAARYIPLAARFRRPASLSMICFCDASSGSARPNSPSSEPSRCSYSARRISRAWQRTSERSAELKQVPEEFNKGMEIGQTELAQKKLDGPADAEPPAPPPTPPPAA